MRGESGVSMIGRYRILGLIGRGGMGRVWRAFDTELGREVAVKELRLPDEIDDAERRQWYARAEREARAAARLRHPGIVALHDRVTGEDGRPWLVMELVAGRSLDAVIREDGPLPPERVADLGRQMLDALTTAHAHGIVHRDVKPANVLLDGDRAVLTDFGIAALDGDATITKSGVLIGTPAYMAPEQVRGRPATAASDLWSLGATLYAAVEGRPPFEGPTHGAIFVAIATEEPSPPEKAGPLADVLTALLQKDPESRATADDVRPRLAPARPAAPPAAPPRTEVLPSPGKTLVAGSERSGLGRRGRVAGIAAGVAVVLAVGTAFTVKGFSGGGAKPRVAASHSSLPPLPADGILDTGTAAAWGLAFSPDGKLLASADDGSTLRLWDTTTGAPVATLAHDTGDSEKSRHVVAFSPDGKILAAENAESQIQFWDVATRRVITTLGDPDGESAVSAAFSPDGRSLAVGVFRFGKNVSIDGRVRVWDVASRRLSFTTPMTNGFIDEPAFSPDSRTLAYGAGKSIRLWDVVQRKESGTIEAGRSVDAVAFSPDGGTIAATGPKTQVGTWDLASRTKRRDLAGGTSGRLAFSRDGRFLASSAEEGGSAVQIWDPGTGTKIRDLGGGSSFSVAVSPDAKVVAGGGPDGKIHLWRL
ncbi:WD40 repeat domain-containing serine/threonine protein kinase [Actinomadura rupiterrae]|uniref:WD40 repeat domain-containing serine/threonine protein kinase n=1 Tax=Actinomadura rupiterrae TaxID=559627 RepID=UPI0020A2779F|nr:serine/threonine-protein kinase [Actinomadura rupiterrae]MCP2340251.1 tRNA A-37 threonylcarbamoyl transferase component Bud32/Tol biopolymer transport system component [Actinomadura rupiterrae]